MPEFLRTHGIVSAITELIEDAESKIVFVSPYLKVSPEFLERIRQAMKRGVKICIVYGKKEMTHSESENLGSLPGIELRFVENLHAKCYFNGQKVIITSMNLYQSSERNVEMGVVLEKGKDGVAFDKACSEIESIMQRSNIGPKNNHQIKSKLSGHCIRCGIFISRDPDKPLCKECYYIWNQYGDPGYPEQFCHTCGQREETSVDRPECYTCYIKGYS